MFLPDPLLLQPQFSGNQNADNLVPYVQGRTAMSVIDINDIRSQGTFLICPYIDLSPATKATP